MAIQGLRHTGNFVTDERPKNWREGILRSEPNGMTPLAGLSSFLKTKKTDDPEYNWFEKRMAGQRFALTAAIDNSQTTVPLAGLDPPTEGGAVVTPQKQLKSGHILLVEESGELVRVNGDPSTATVTVVRAQGGTSAAAVDHDGAGVNPNLTVIGTAHEEGSDAPTGINYDVTKKYNFTQIFRNTLQATRTARKTRLRTGDQIKEAKREALQYHMNEIERAIIFGGADEDLTGSTPRRMTGGILGNDPDGNPYIAAANTIDIGASALSGLNAGEFKVTHLMQWLELMFREGAQEKMAFCGNMALLQINEAIRKGKNISMNIESGVKEFGMKVTRLTCPFGELVLKTHPLFNLNTGGTTTAVDYFGYNSALIALDMSELVWRPLDDTFFEKVLQGNGEDAMKSGYLTEAGLEIHHPTHHFILKGLANGLAE